MYEMYEKVTSKN